MPVEEDDDQTRDNLGVVLNRISRRQVATGLSDRSLSLKAGKSNDYVRSMRRQWAGGRQQHASNESLLVLAKALETTPEWLARGEGLEHVEPEKKKAALTRHNHKVPPLPAPSTFAQPAADGKLLTVNCSVAANVWIDGKQPIVATAVSINPDARYLHADQYAYLVQDNSADLVAGPGNIVITADIGRPRPGDHVIVYRSKGDLHEITLRKVMRQGNVLLLSHDSTDQTLTGDVIKIAEGTEHAEDGTEIKLEGILIAVYRQL